MTCQSYDLRVTCAALWNLVMAYSPPSTAGSFPVKLVALSKPTFAQLDHRKRQRVLNAAIAEFADHPYDRANLDRIAGAAGVAKGSLYQYFHNKRGCFDVAVQSAFGSAFSDFERYLRRSRSRDCFDEFRHALLFAIVLRERQPVIARVYLRVGFLETPELQGEIRSRNTLFQERWFERGISEGLLDPRIDRISAGFLLDAIANRFHFLALSGTLSQRSLRALAASLARHVRTTSPGRCRRSQASAARQAAARGSPRSSPEPRRGDIRALCDGRQGSGGCAPMASRG